MKALKTPQKPGLKPGLLRFFARNTNEKAVDNYMTKRWISHDENMNCMEPHLIHDDCPQSYPRAFLNDNNDLTYTIHGIHRYINKKQQLFIY
jgi:hypothetical protein